jgi:anti-sigma factor RsiW
VTCTDFIALLDELIDDSIPAETRAEMQEHLRGCEHCEVTLSTTRMTIQFYQRNEVYELPDTVRQRLHDAIIARCKHGC